MNPIIVITLLLLGIGGAYFLMINLGDAQVAAGGTANPLLTNYGALACKILIVVLLLYMIYYIADVIKTSAQQRKIK
jgi:hypothetical protein